MFSLFAKRNFFIQLLLLLLCTILILAGEVKSLAEGTPTEALKLNEGHEDFENEEALLSPEAWPLLEEDVRVKRASRDEREEPKKKSKKKENRRKISISLVGKIIEEKLVEHLMPLETALQIIRLDSFSESIMRQLSSFELIQSKLLTEYGELRAAVNEVGRHLLDMGRQVAGLDERLASLDRQMPHRMDVSGIRKDRTPVSFSEVSQTTEMLKEALVAVTSKISSSERRFKDDLTLLGNRTTESIKATQNFLDRRIAEVAMETGQVLTSVEKLINQSTCSGQYMTSSNGAVSSISMTSSPVDRFLRRQQPHKSAADGSREELVYLPAEEKSNARPEREGRSHPPMVAPFTGWVRPLASPTEVLGMNQGTVTKLAAEIAKQISNEGEFQGPRDCFDISSKGERRSQIYAIFPASCSRRFAVKVWCDMNDVPGGGWTIIQRRGPWDVPPASSSPPSSASFFPELNSSGPPPVEFFRDWADYKWGFGDLHGEHWLGNEYIHHLTQSGDYDLRIELFDWNSELRWAQYSHFSIAAEAQNYTLYIGQYSGNAGNSLKHHHGIGFSTRDRDNDANPVGHCARTFHGAWWFTSCHEAHLNGRYHKGRHKIYGDGINWLAFRGHNYSLMKSRMMIRPSEKHP